MPSAYPGALDTLTNPTSSDTLASVPHADQHADANNAITAIQETLGVNPQGSAATVAARIAALEGGGGGGGGTKTLARWTAADGQPPASGFATLDTRNSILVLDFDSSSTESAVFMGIVPDGAVLTSGVSVRLHWAATSATSGNVRWRVEFDRMTTDIDGDSYDTATEATAATTGTSGVLTATSITCTTIDSMTAGDPFRVRVSRVGGDAADTMSGDAELIAVELRQVA